MKVFQNLFKAKWKHKDPDVRKNALLGLEPSSNQDVFLEVANTDANTEIRILAIKRISNISNLKSISANNSESKARELAAKILCQVYAGELEMDLSTEDIPGEIESLNDQKIIEYVCKNGISSTIRRKAIEHLSRDALLGDLAINDLDPALRVFAAKKIEQQSTLERVYKNTKTRDKTVSGIVKTKLDEILEAQQEPLRRLDQQKQLCLQLENLGSKGLWERDKLQFDAIQKQWNELQEHDTELQTRYERALQSFTASYESYLKRHEERLKLEQALLPIKEKKQQIISKLNTLPEEVNQLSAEDNISEFRQRFDNLKNSWQTTEKLPAEIEEEFSTQYKAVCDTLQSTLKQHAQSNELIRTFKSIEKDLNRILEKPRLITVKTLDGIESRFNKAQGLTGNELSQQLKSNVKSLIHKAKDQFNRNEKTIEEQLKILEKELATMEKKLEAGVLKEAIAARNTVQSAISKLEDLGYRKLSSFKKRATNSINQINELANWRSWANTPQKEELCQKVEALIGSNEHPKDIAFIINQAKKDWKKLGPSERNTSQELWERFQAACESAYEPCKSYFEDEAKFKQENYKKRLEFVENMEKFIEAANWDNIDWKKVESLFRHSRNEWKDLGHTEAEQRKVLNKRFYAAYEILKEHLNKEWAQNKEQKQKIVEEAQALKDEEDLSTAINKAKDLQNRWKTAGRIPQKQERALWADFRSACDQVFNRREQIKEQEKEELNTLAEKKSQLIEELDKIVRLPIEELFQQKGNFEKIRQEYTSTGATIKSKDAELDKRLTEILHIFERKMESAGRLEIVSKLRALQQVAHAIEKIENAIASNSSPMEINELIEAAQQAFENNKNLLEKEWISSIENRLNNAISIASTQNFKEVLSEKISNIAEDKQFATIQLEILANVDTPAEYANDRLTVQAQRLNEKLQNHEDEDHWQAFVSTESKWWLLGPTDTKDLDAFNSRRIAAISHLKDEYREELETYQ